MTLLLLALSPGFMKLGLVMLIISSIIMGFITKLRKLFTKNKKALFLYILVILVFFALTGLLANDRVLENSVLGNFISFQVFFLLYGSLHIWVMRRFFADVSEKLHDFWPEFLYTLVVGIWGLTGFLFTIQYFKIDYTYDFLAAGFCFLIPYFVVKLYEYGVAIPLPIYKTWEYPIGQSIKDRKDQEFKDLKVISFEFNKDEAEREIVNFRLRAPENMEFGRLFYFFIGDYNEKHPESKIHFKNTKNQPDKWIFYSKPNLLGYRKYYDYAKTVRENGIKENDIILCKRAD